MNAISSISSMTSTSSYQPAAAAASPVDDLQKQQGTKKAGHHGHGHRAAPPAPAPAPATDPTDPANGIDGTSTSSLFDVTA
jgi:hypothetical protein